MGTSLRRFLLAATALWLVNLVLFPEIACAQLEKDRKFEVGVHVSTLGIDDPHTTSPPAIPGSARRELGFGGRLGFNLNKYVGFEGEINYFPRDYRRFITDETGGPVTQGLFGIKIGVRGKRFGFFGKARPGFQSSGQSAIARFPNGDGPNPQDPFGFEVVRAFQPTIDLGGIVEWYPRKRWLFRVDVGDTITRYSELAFVCFPSGTPCPLVPVTHKLQVNVGVGFRF